MRGKLLAFAGVVALHVDEEALVGERGEHLVERGHQADALAAQGKCLAAVGGVAVADVELLQIGHRVIARRAVALGAAVERPVVEDREIAVGRRMDVELDDVGAGGKRRLHRGEGVLDELVLGLIDARRRAGVALEILARIGLREAAVCQENGRAGLRV